MNYIEKLKFKFGGENVLVKVTNEKYVDLFEKYQQCYKDLYIVPLEDLESLIKDRKTEGRDYCFLTTDKGYGEYQYDHCIYEYTLKKGGGCIAFTIYKKKKSFDKMYNKMIDTFKTLYFKYDDIDKAMQKAFDKVIEDS